MKKRELPEARLTITDPEYKGRVHTTVEGGPLKHVWYEITEEEEKTTIGRLFTRTIIPFLQRNVSMSADIEKKRGEGVVITILVIVAGIPVVSREFRIRI